MPESKKAQAGVETPSPHPSRRVKCPASLPSISRPAKLVLNRSHGSPLFPQNAFVAHKDERSRVLILQYAPGLWNGGKLWRSAPRHSTGVPGTFRRGPYGLCSGGGNRTPLLGACLPCQTRRSGDWDKHLLVRRPGTRTCRARSEIVAHVPRPVRWFAESSLGRKANPFHNLTVQKRGAMMQQQLVGFSEIRSELHGRHRGRWCEHDRRTGIRPSHPS